MVFDFFKKRATEGFDQISKLTDAASRGELGKALEEAASYTAETNRAFASGLAKSRAKLLNSLDNMVNNEGRDVLDDLETLLFQSDLGLVTTEDIMREAWHWSFVAFLAQLHGYDGTAIIYVIHDDEDLTDDAYEAMNQPMRDMYDHLTF